MGATRIEQASCPKNQRSIWWVGGFPAVGTPWKVTSHNPAGNQFDMVKKSSCGLDDSSHVGNSWSRFHGADLYGSYLLSPRCTRCTRLRQLIQPCREKLMQRVNLTPRAWRFVDSPRSSRIAWTPRRLGFPGGAGAAAEEAVPGGQQVRNRRHGPNGPRKARENPPAPPPTGGREKRQYHGLDRFRVPQLQYATIGNMCGTFLDNLSSLVHAYKVENMTVVSWVGLPVQLRVSANGLVKTKLFEPPFCAG